MENIHGACDSIFGDGGGRRSGPFFFFFTGCKSVDRHEACRTKKKKRTNVPLIFNGMS